MGGGGVRGSGRSGGGWGSNRTPGQGLGPLRRHLGQSEEPGRLWEAVMLLYQDIKRRCILWLQVWLQVAEITVLIWERIGRRMHGTRE